MHRETGAIASIFGITVFLSVVVCLINHSGIWGFFGWIPVIMFTCSLLMGIYGLYRRIKKESYQILIESSRLCGIIFLIWTVFYFFGYIL